MYRISFYTRADGSQPIKEYLLELAAQSGKDARIKLNKIQEYVEILKRYGTTAGEPYMKHIEDGIWELRPQRNRIFFFCSQGGTFVLLHHFVKKTQKTPRKEIQAARRNMNDHLSRSNDNGA